MMSQNFKSMTSPFYTLYPTPNRNWNSSRNRLRKIDLRHVVQNGWPERRQTCGDPFGIIVKLRTYYHGKVLPCNQKCCNSSRFSWIVSLMTKTDLELRDSIFNLFTHTWPKNDTALALVHSQVQTNPS